VGLLYGPALPGGVLGEPPCRAALPAQHFALDCLRLIERHSVF
jgi:hypothetical protein